MKKIIAILLALIMVTGLLPITVQAETPEAYTGQTAPGSYIIFTADQLALLAEKVNEGEAYDESIFTLTSDIDLSSVCNESGESWVPIGNSTNGSSQFQGVFDGNGHIIRKLYINSTVNGQGLFGYIGTGGIVKQLGLTDSTIIGSARYIGGIAVYNYGTITSCFSGVDITTDKKGAPFSDTMAGGIAAVNKGTISYCYYYGTININADAYRVGGICGYTDNMLSNCYSRGTINVTGTIRKVCAVAGNSADNKGTFIKCYYLSSLFGDNKVGEIELALGASALLSNDRLGTVDFMPDTENINEGYPILAWQKTDHGSNVAPVITAANPSTITTRKDMEYLLPLNTAFSDTDGDNLTYTVQIDGSVVVPANKDYHFTPTRAGIYTFCFRASDEYDESPEYIVVLNAVDDSALQAIISDAPTKGYYTSQDRYNGHPTDTISTDDVPDSFWENMQSISSEAIGVYNNLSATQSQVDDAASELTAAINKLIPIININATALYEELQLSNLKAEEDYTAATWSDFETARTAAQNILAQLYDADGNPTEYNSSTDGTAAADVVSATEGLTAARENLCLKSVSFRYSSTVNKINEKVNKLIKIINQKPLIKEDYTAASWSAYQAALAAAQEAPTLNGTAADEAAVNHYKAAYAALYDAYYSGLQPSAEQITVALNWIDRIESKAYKGTVELQAGDSIEDMLEQKGLAISHAGYRQHIYLNGVYLDESNRAGTEPTKRLPDLSTIILHPGDRISVSWNIMPESTQLPSIGNPEANISQYEDDLKIDAFTQTDGITVEAGQKLTLEVTETRAAFGLARQTVQAEGLSLYSSIQQESRGALCQTAQPVVIDGQAVVTDTEGTAEAAFYEEGWYLVGAYDTRTDIKGNIPNTAAGDPTKGTYYSVKSGALIWVHVTASSNPSAVKASLKAQLDSVYKEYPESYFRVEPLYGLKPEEIGALNSWTNLKAYYDTAVSAISAAATIGEAYQAQKTGIQEIKNIQEDATNENIKLVADLRECLSRLPEDSALITTSIKSLVDDVVELYGTKLSDYQKTRLTTAEQELCSFVMNLAAQEGGLPAGQGFDLTYEIKADTADAVAAIEDMIGYLQSNNTMKWWGQHESTKARDAWENQGNRDAKKLLYFYPNGSDTTIYQANPDTNVVVAFDVGQYAYLLVREDEDHSITGTVGSSWTISDKNFKLGESVDDFVGYDVLRNMTVMVGGTEYELKSIEFVGIDSRYVSYKEAPSFIDRSTYQERSLTDTRVNIHFPQSMLAFTMPYEDVNVIFNWGTVGSENDLKEAKDAAIAALEAKYNSFDLDKYDEAGQNALSTAKNNGVAEIESAGSLSDITKAKNAAIAAMMAVSVKADQKEPLPEGVSLPNYGDVVGQVKISVRNDTYKGGDLKGKILDGWYDLCVDDTMMTAALKALATEGYTWKGTGGKGGVYDYDITYLASVEQGNKKLAEFSGAAGSGWMGTLNDWFVNEGFQNFTVKKGTLENGDIIAIRYTQNLGEDLGGTWKNGNTTLKSLEISGGTLAPHFKGSISEYTLLIDKERTSVMLTPTASNKNFLVKAFLNYYNRDSAFYKRTESISVKDGDTIYIGVGDKAWPSMNKQGTEATAYEGTKYVLKVIKQDAGIVVTLIDALPSAGRITYSTYGDYLAKIEAARVAYDALADKSGVTNYVKLTAAEEKIEYYSEIEGVKALLEAIPYVDKVTISHKSAVLAADSAYKKLDEEQRKYITVGDVTNYNAAIEKLTALGAFASGNKPSPISGNAQEPGEDVVLNPVVKALNGIAAVAVSSSDMASAIAEAKESESTAIIIAPEVTGAVKKMSINLSKESLASIAASTTADLKVETPMGNMMIPNSILDSVASQASGSNVTISLESVDYAALTNAQRKEAGDNPVYDISILSEDKHISSFNGEKIKIALPYLLKDGEDAEGITVWYLNESGELEKITCTYSKASGMASFTTDHLSYYVVGWSEVWQNPFADVKDTDWFYSAVEFAIKKKLFNGTSETAFSPDSSMTRAMLVTVLHRLDESPLVEGENGFADVMNDQWYTDAVLWADVNGITAGIGNGSFGTNNNVTREQLATILCNYANYKGYDVAVTAGVENYADAVAISGWAQTAMKWANSEGLITGRTTTTLVPGGSASRAEVATILQRFIDVIE